jgi:hypothetical protein
MGIAACSGSSGKKRLGNDAHGRGVAPRLVSADDGCGVRARIGRMAAVEQQVAGARPIAAVRLEVRSKP